MKTIMHLTTTRPLQGADRTSYFRLQPHRRAAVFLLGVGLLFSAAPVWGTPFNWEEGTTGNWNEAAKWWSLGGPAFQVPGNQDQVSIAGEGSIVGITGSAEANIVNVLRNATVNLDGSDASLSVSDGPVFGWLNVGSIGHGTLNILNGATLTTDNAQMAEQNSGATGSVMIDGSGSTWTNHATNASQRNLYMGWQGDADVTVSNGGKLITHSPILMAQNSNLNIGAPSGMTSLAPGVIDAESITSQDIGPIVVFNHANQTAEGYSFTNTGGASGEPIPIEGNVTIVHENGVTVLPGGSESYINIEQDINITGGTLVVDSVVSSRLFSVSGSGTLSGTGETRGAVTIGAGGILSPGNSPGILAGTDETWAGGGKYRWEINQANGTAGFDWDLRQLSESLTITATNPNPFVLELISLDALNDAGALLNWDATLDYEWTIATVANNNINGIDEDSDLDEIIANGQFNPGWFYIDSTQFVAQNPTADPNNFRLALSGDYNSLVLHYDASDMTAVPEPGSAVALALLLTSSVGLHRQRSRTSRAQA